ncbi:MAG: YkgJ family cysteine cluster protein [Myxococcota bacterium]|nr:YkgJ family cysteine cluster protein [Myxococcota bacterium]
MSDGSEKPWLRVIQDWHGALDEKVRPFEERHADRLQCRMGCHDCCMDGITVFEVEALEIQERCAPLLEQEEPHPPGKCAFLDVVGGCRIYAHRPYVCRTQGLPLRWVEEEGDEVMEYRDICPLNEEGEALETLPGEVFWTLGPLEGELAQMQAERDGGAMKRVALRDLFKRV